MVPISVSCLSARHSGSPKTWAVALRGQVIIHEPSKFLVWARVRCDNKPGNFFLKQIFKKSLLKPRSFIAQLKSDITRLKTCVMTFTSSAVLHLGPL